MKNKPLRVEYVPVESLKPYEGNAKQHPDWQIEQIKLSMEEFGNLDPIGVWKDEIVEGHGRLIAARDLGMETVPIIRLDQLTDKQRRAYALVHNKLTMNTDFDLERLQEELDALDGFDMSQYGFDELQKQLDDLDIQEDEFDPTLPEKPKAKRGDIYQLGDHRLMCGDSTSEEDLRNLMGGVRADMVFTDPPYGVAIGDKNALLKEYVKSSKNAITENIEGDTLSPEELYQMLTKAFRNLRENAAADHCSYYVSSPQGGDLGLIMLQMMRDAGLAVRHMLIWVKNTATFSLGRLDYDYRHEPIFYTWTKKHEFYGGYNTTVIDDTAQIEKMSKKELLELARKLMFPKPDTVIYEGKPAKNDLHPTMKPIRLVARFILNSSKTGDAVADIFGGSGSTLMACEQTGRRCYMMELDPHYVDVIIRRWEEFTGRKATKVTKKRK